ncbi:universal stress protein [Eionea flava]
MLTTINTILCAVNFNDDTSSELLSMGLSLSEKYQAKVTLLNVVRPVDASVFYGGSIELWDEIEENTLSRAKSELENLANDFFDQRAIKEEAITRPNVEIIKGHAAESIVKYADIINAGMIIMGSNAHSAIGQFLLGSVADRVMRTSKRPVLLVPVSG